MSYSFLLDREPSDEELKMLTDSAIKNAKEKKEATLAEFMLRLKNELEMLKKAKHQNAE